VAGVLADMPGTAAAPPALDARLTTITSRAHAGGAALVIEATEPVPYLTAQPDPLTVVVDFRNVSTEGLANSVAAGAPGPIAGVAVEAAEAMGARLSRVRISLVEPVAHQIHSDRNRVVVNFERAPGGTAPASGPGPRDPIAALLVPPAPRAAQAPAPAAAQTAPEPAPETAAQIVPAIAPQTAPPAGPAIAQQTTVPDTAPIGGPSLVAAALAQQQPAPAPTVNQEQPTVRGGGREYTGNPVSLDFQQMDLRAVLRLFSEISGLNIVIDPAVQGSVDVRLEAVPWDQALDIILRANKLGYIVDGTIIRIAPLVVLADEEAQRRKLADEQALAGDLRVMTHTLSYARGEDLVQLLTRSALSQRGSVQVDQRTNTLIITDLQDRLTTASELLQTLDQAQPQVEIEARIVQTSTDYARSLGINWNFNGRVDPALGNTTNLAFPNSGTLSGGTDLPISGAPTSTAALTLGSVNGAFNLDAALSALESSGNGRLLSTPRVSTQNNVPAEITQGTQIPIQTVANNTVTVTFKDAALTLRVTPQITASNTVIMRVELENAEPDFGRSVNGIPPIDTQRASTTVLVNDGQTTVIGGIYLSREDQTTDRTPGLSQVPLLKWLFKRDTVSERNTELLIFITPRIFRG
jgi:type IV pilus assembly protein PilQ